MTKTEDRLADALDAAARAVPEESLRPLVEPVPDTASATRDGRAGWRLPQPRWASPW